MVLIIFHGRVRSLAQWGQECGIGKHTLYERLRRGWPVARALSLSAEDGRRTRHPGGKAHPCYRHGLSNTKVWNVWRSMIQRCEDRNRKDYKYYGGRGIVVCKRWHSFVAFVADMGEPPDGLSLDRKNNDGPYSKRNCRWATPKEQGMNKGNTHLVTFRGETRLLTEWSSLTGFRYQTLWHRLFVKGLPASVALTQPLRRYP